MKSPEWMKELGDVAREDVARAENAPSALASPLTDAELDAMAERAAGALGLGNVRPLKAPPPRRWGAVLGGASAALALAAAASLWVRQPSGVGGVAAYDLVVEGGERATRGDPGTATGPLVLAKDGRVAFILRPHAASAKDVGVRSMVEHAGTLQTWVVPVRVSAEGVVRLDASPRELGALPEGPSRVVLFLGPPAALPDGEAAAKRELESPPADVQVITKSIVVGTP